MFSLNLPDNPIIIFMLQIRKQLSEKQSNLSKVTPQVGAEADFKAHPSIHWAVLSWTYTSLLPDSVGPYNADKSEHHGFHLCPNPLKSQQDQLHNLQGPVPNKNAGALFKKERKSFSLSSKISLLSSHDDVHLLFNAVFPWSWGYLQSEGRPSEMPGALPHSSSNGVHAPNPSPLYFCFQAPARHRGWPESLGRVEK